MNTLETFIILLNFMSTFPMVRCAAGPHDTKTLMHIYLISVSINRMLISQLKKMFV